MRDVFRFNRRENARDLNVCALIRPHKEERTGTLIEMVKEKIHARSLP